MTYDEFEKAITPLRQKQREFLRRRALGLNDSRAAEGVVSRVSVFQWKKDNKFMKLYDEAAYISTGVPESIRNLPAVVPETGRVLYTNEVVEEALAKLPAEVTLDEAVALAQNYDFLRRFLPLIVNRHLGIILDSRTPVRELTSLMKLYYELIGFTPESRLPGGHRNQVIVNTLNLLAPQIASQAEERGLNVPQIITDAVEADYKVVDDYLDPYQIQVEKGEDGSSSGSEATQREEE